MKKIILIVLFMFLSRSATAATLNVDIPSLGIENYSWPVETNTELTNQQLALAACEKTKELLGNKACTDCWLLFTAGWYPGTGAYRLSIKASVFGHSHYYGYCGAGGSDELIFGYNSDAHSRYGHCIKPTAPGRIDLGYSGTYLGCHETGTGHFSAEYCDEFLVEYFSGSESIINPLPLSGQKIHLNVSVSGNSNPAELAWTLTANGQVVAEGLGISGGVAWDGRNGEGKIGAGIYDLLLSVSNPKTGCAAEQGLTAILELTDECKLRATFPSTGTN